MLNHNVMLLAIFVFNDEGHRPASLSYCLPFPEARFRTIRADGSKRSRRFLAGAIGREHCGTTIPSGLPANARIGRNCAMGHNISRHKLEAIERACEREQ